MLDFTDKEEEFARAEEQASQFDTIPDGKYAAKVTETRLRMNAGKRMLTWTLEIIDGQYTGRRLWRNNILETESNFAWLKRDLALCGTKLTRLGEINEKAAELVGVVLQVQVKSDDRFTNVYLNKRLAEGEEVYQKESESTGSTGSETDAEDRIPF